MTPVADLLGRPLRDLRVAVTDRCNFRCDYCMPENAPIEFLPRERLLTFEEVTRIAQLSVRHLGVRKLRLTGGEPLLRRDLPTLVAMLARIERLQDLALTTNGYLLQEQAAALARAGLQRITVSLDSLDDNRFAAASGRGEELTRVLRGIDAAIEAGLAPVKLNCVVRRNFNEPDVVSIADYARERGLVARFIEYMDVGTLNDWRSERVVPAADILQLLRSRGPLVPVDEPRFPGQVAERYRYRDFPQEVGIIAAVTRPFCGDCSRGRLSADGRFLTCLFAPGGIDLQGPLRSGAADRELIELIHATWRARHDRHSELRLEHRGETPRRRLEMYQIGG